MSHVQIVVLDKDDNEDALSAGNAALSESQRKTPRDGSPKADCVPSGVSRQTPPQVPENGAAGNKIHDATSGLLKQVALDLENAFSLENNSVVEISGIRHVIHVDHDERQVVAIPLCPAEPKKTSLNLRVLASLVGRKGPGRPSKRDSDINHKISLAIIASATTILVQIPIEEIPPTLRMSHLCERLLRTIVDSQPSATKRSRSLEFDTDLGPLTLKVSLAVLDGSVDWIDDVLIVPLYKSDYIEDLDIFKKISLQPIIDEDLICPSCNFKTFYEAHLSLHLVDKHPEMKLDECIRCALFFPNNRCLFDHFVKRHSELTCVPCAFMARKVYQMKRHNERHDDSVSNRCEQCGNVYKDQYILKEHIQSVHEQCMVYYECTNCSKHFERKAHLVRHMKTHGTEKAYSCPACAYKTNERGDLNKHVRIHSEPSYKCKICGKAFIHRKSLKLHEKRHTGIKDFKCGFCEFYGYTPNHIKRHIDRMHRRPIIELV